MISKPTAPTREPSRFRRPSLRQATVVLPSTGERLRRRVTLHEPNTVLPIATTPEQHSSTFVTRAKAWIVKSSMGLWAYLTSRAGLGVLKCSLAYLFATFAVFFTVFTRILGTGDGKHLVANVVVWYHPARSSGSMDQGSIYALTGFAYSVAVCALSMGIATLFASFDRLEVGHALILIFCCAGGLGFLAYVKQRQNNPLVNVSISLAAIPIVGTITKDPSVHEGHFSAKVLSTTARMAIMAILLSSLVCVLLWPIRAREDLRKNLTETTTSLSEILGDITSSFLAGTDDDMKKPAFVEATDKFNSNIASLDGVLKEARNERYLIGREARYHIEERLVQVMEELAQDVGGLRSAADMQFDLLAESAASGGPILEPPARTSTAQTEASLEPPRSIHIDATKSDQPSTNCPTSTAIGSAISSPLVPSSTQNISQQSGVAAPHDAAVLESHDLSSSSTSQPDVQIDKEGSLRSTSSADIPMRHAELTQSTRSVASAAEIFLTFIDLLGPPMKSLAFTLKQIMKELPFSAKDHAVVNHPVFRTSLSDALELYKKSRKAALNAVYESKSLTKARKESIAAEFEEVAASCGHFSSSLEDIAEHCLRFLDVLSELDLDNSRMSNNLSWWWLCFWLHESNKADLHDHKARLDFHMPNLAIRRHNNLTQDEKNKVKVTLRWRLWRALRVLRSDEVRYAFKVGVGAAMLALFAFLPATQETFYHWRLEWAVSTYMFACSMTLGQANTTTLQRIQGVFIGAALAITAWVVARGNAVVLAFLGWIMSYGCFYIMNVQNQGPMARFILLTYNLTTLYSYSLSINDQTRDEDEGGVDPHIWEIALHRITAIIIGCVWGLIVTRAIWPIKARRKLRAGLSLLWLRMGLIWVKAPLSILMEAERKPSNNMDIRDEMSLRKFADTLNTLRTNAESEFMLRGPFPTDDYKALLSSTSRMLNSIHALNVVISKDLKASVGEMELLKFTTAEREQLAKRISHLLNVLASSMQLEYPINDVLPDISNTRDRFLAKLFEFRADDNKSKLAKEEDYELLYTYALVTAQLAKEIDVTSKVIERLYGTLSEDILKLS